MSDYRYVVKGLTSGKAVFGSPGIGCQGPYKMRSLLIETTHG